MAKRKCASITNGFEKMVRTAIYEGPSAEGENADSIFVPSEAMWTFRDALRPTEVCKRAGIKRTLWNRWRSNFGWESWQIRYLYGAPIPDGKRVDYLRPWQKNPIQQSDSDRLIADPEMMRFRKAASSLSVCKNLQADGLTSQSVSKWQKDHEDIEWFQDWLLFQLDVGMVVRSHLVSSCRAAWNYAGILRTLGITSSLYYRWFRLFPT